MNIEELLQPEGQEQIRNEKVCFDLVDNFRQAVVQNPNESKVGWKVQSARRHDNGQIYIVGIHPDGLVPPGDVPPLPRHERARQVDQYTFFPEDVKQFYECDADVQMAGKKRRKTRKISKRKSTKKSKSRSRRSRN